MLYRTHTDLLEVAYEQAGPDQGRPVVLLHGYPYSPRAFDGVVPPLVAAGHRVIVPFLRGYGATKFLSPATPRSGQQAALGADLLALLDALDISRAVLAGFDWGGRGACIVAALWPERVTGLVSCAGYTIQNIAVAPNPEPPEQEYRLWYQFYFHTERGRAGLAAHRGALCRLLWRLWSPNWVFDEATLARTVAVFDNPDFVEVVIHSYRHRYGVVPGDPAVEPIERLLAARPRVTVPTVVLDGGADGVSSPSQGDAAMFTGRYRHEVLPRIGHNVPQEAPDAFARAVLDLGHAA
jgi:pimeloyl-ACP methyl ester carboxylesterase